MDWGIGEYEFIAPQLEPVADAVVAVAEIQPGERVLDLGCGTGNAALRAARQGGMVTAVDPSPRLRDVAAGRAAQEELDITVLAGEGAAIPLEDQSVDGLLSVFAVVFAPDADAAAAEMTRVLADTGRIVLSAWKPERALAAMGRAISKAVRDQLNVAEPPPPFAWHDPQTVSGLFAAHGLVTTCVTKRISFTAESPRAYVENESRHHPRSVEALGALGETAAQQLRDDLTALLEELNEDRSAFRVTSDYVIVTARRIG